MPLSSTARVLYTAILRHRDRNPATVVTYTQLEMATGINTIAQRFPLQEIFQACDARRLPPLTSIVVQQGTASPDGRYGTPGDGYFLEDEASGNQARRNKDADITRRVRCHQDSVHDFTGTWLDRL